MLDTTKSLNLWEKQPKKPEGPGILKGAPEKQKTPEKKASKPAGETKLLMMRASFRSLENLQKQMREGGKTTEYKEKAKWIITLIQDDFERHCAFMDTHKFALFSLAENIISTHEAVWSGEYELNGVGAFFDQLTFVAHEFKSMGPEFAIEYVIYSELIEYKKKLWAYEDDPALLKKEEQWLLDFKHYLNTVEKEMNGYRSRFQEILESEKKQIKKRPVPQTRAALESLKTELMG